MSRCRARLAAVAAVATLLAPEPGRALTTLNGEYQLMLDMRKSQRVFPWDWESNNNDNYAGAWFKLFSQPLANAETFVRIEADWHSTNNQSPRPEFQFREAHLRYRWDLRDRGLEAYLFSRQDRFWVDNYLYQAVQGGALKNDDNAQGIRISSWGFLGMGGSRGSPTVTFIASDFSGQFNPTQFPGNLPRDSVASARARMTDDAYIVRLRRELLDKRLRLGFTYNRKEETEFNERLAKAQVFAFDGRYQWLGTDFSLEYAQSRSPLQASDPTIQFPEALGQEPLGLPDRSVLVAEIRSLRLGNRKLGFLNVVPTYWRRGPLFENRAGDGNRDLTEYQINSWYLVPERAITLTARHLRNERKATERREYIETYGEVYVEFVKGFTGKTFLRQRETRQTRFNPILARFETTSEDHDDLFAEVQVESRLAWLRVQSKIKDLGIATRRELYSVETSINLTDKLKVYNRFTFNNATSILRNNTFSELQYRPTGNVWMFLQYGPFWIGDSSTPVDDGDLEGGTDQEDLFRFLMRGQF